MPHQIKNRVAADQYNHYRVPRKNWLKWSVKARHTFNAIYDFMMENQDVMLHPKQEPPKPDHWKTIAWNAAWIAADAVDDALPEIVSDSKTGTERKTKLRVA